MFLSATARASTPAPAAVTSQNLAMIGNDQTGGLSQLAAVVDEASLRGILFRQIKGGTPGDNPLRKFTVAQMMAPQGVVLVKEQGYDAVLLQARADASPISSRQNAGAKFNVEVRYLQNALTGDYGRCQLALEKGDEGSWFLRNVQSGNKISKILVKTWTMGITTLQGVCPNAKE